MAEASVRIEFIFTSGDVAGAVERGLAPDNVDLPAGMKLHMQRTEGKLMVEVEHQGPLETLAATVDEIISHVDACCRTLTELES